MLCESLRPLLSLRAFHRATRFIMFEIEIKRSSRRCCQTEREFAPGDVYFSVLTEGDDDFVRNDYSEQAWQGPPDNAIAWWRCQVPVPGKNKVYWAPPDALLAYFQQLYERPDKQTTCFVMALLLMRKRLLSAEPHAADPGYLVLNSAKLGTQFKVAECDVGPEQLAEIQSELSEHLFMDQPHSPDAVEGETSVQSKPLES